MRRWLALILALLMLLALTGCGDQDEAPDEQAAEQAEQTDETASADQPEEKTTDWKPEKEVTILVADAAGSLNDITARVLAQYLERRIGQRINVEDIPGVYTETNDAGEVTFSAGAGTLGWLELAGREPDGLTLGYIGLPDFSNALFQWPDLILEDAYTPICTHTTQTAVLVVRGTEHRFNSLRKLVTYSKNHGGLVASTDGERGLLHTWTQLFAKSVDMPYNVNHQSSADGALQCLRDGSADFCIVRTDDILERDEDLTVLGVFGTQRLEQYPDAPTLSELGIYDNWLGCANCVAAPAGVSEDVVTFYEQAFRDAMADERYLAASSGVTTEYKNAAETAELFARQRRIALRVSNSLWW